MPRSERSKSRWTYERSDELAGMLHKGRLMKRHIFGDIRQHDKLFPLSSHSFQSLPYGRLQAFLGDERSGHTVVEQLLELNGIHVGESLAEDCFHLRPFGYKLRILGYWRRGVDVGCRCSVQSGGGMGLAKDGRILPFAHFFSTHGDEGEGGKRCA